MKKAISVILVVCMLFSVLALPAQAEENVPEPSHNHGVAITGLDDVIALRYVACPVGPGACVFVYRQVKAWDQYGQYMGLIWAYVCNKCGTWYV